MTHSTPLRLAFASACLALHCLCSAQTPQVLVFDGGHDDRGHAVATDASGSIFVGGYSNTDGVPATFAVLKYNAAGSLQWLARAQGLGEYNASVANDVVVDATGNVYAAGYAVKPLPFLQNDLAGLVASFDANGNQRWAKTYNGVNNSFDVARSVALHPQQGLYVTGVTADAFGRSDWITIKYSLNGVEQWRRIEAGSVNTDDQPVAIKADAAGNVVVLGWVTTLNLGGPKDLRIVKYDPQGNVLWRADYSDTAISDESPNALAIDANGNIYAVADRGVSTSPELGTTPVTLKYDANGNRLFVLAGPGRGGSAIALDGAGNFIVSGLSNEENGTNEQRITAKFTPNGAPIWSLPIYGQHLAADVLDSSTYLTRELGFTTAKISSSGQLLWEQPVPQGNIVYDALVDDATGAFIVTGISNLGNGNILTARFAAGNTPPPPPPPTVPAAPSALNASAAKNALTLNWTDNANNETGFRIEQSINGGSFVQVAQVGANVRTYNNTGLNKRNSYAYRVRAFNANGNSAYSNTASGVPR